MISLENAKKICQLSDEGFCPHPVTCWRDKDTGEIKKIEEASPLPLFAKIIEEAAEAMRACTAYDKHHAGQELTDIITAATTALDWLGFDIISRAELQKEVNEKNQRRGYLSDGE